LRIHPRLARRRWGNHESRRSSVLMSCDHRSARSCDRAGRRTGLADPAETMVIPYAPGGGIEMPSVRERLRELGADVVAPERRSPEYLQKFVVSEIEKWAVAIKASGVSMD
jgi:hypothetical protein